MFDLHEDKNIDIDTIFRGVKIQTNVSLRGNQKHRRRSEFLVNRKYRCRSNLRDWQNIEIGSIYTSVKNADLYMIYIGVKI